MLRAPLAAKESVADRQYVSGLVACSKDTCSKMSCVASLCRVVAVVQTYTKSHMLDLSCGWTRRWLIHSMAWVRGVGVYKVVSLSLAFLFYTLAIVSLESKVDE